MKEVKERHSKVCQSVLATFSAFVEWVPMQHIMANDHYLVKCLCHLLSDETLQLHAAECLLGIVSSKVGKLTDRAQLMVLFKSDMISPLFQAVEAGNLKSMQGEDDQHYLFLKRMVQILVELGGQVCAIWSAKEVANHSKPENFDIYLNALLAFTSHNSLVINYYANELWAKFSRHPDMSKDEVFQAFIPKWVECALKKAVRVGYPSREDHPSCTYSRMDFETDEEFSSFFGRYRIIMGEVIRIISTSNPTYAYQYCDRWLRALLASNSQGANFISKTSQIYIELDAIQWALDAVLAKLTTREELAPILSPGLELLKLCLEHNTGNDPLLLSVVLSCISSLFVVVTVTPPALNPTLSCIFKCITFTNNKDPMSEEIRALRRHGCALMVKISARHPQTLVPVFDYLRQTIVDDLFIKNTIYKMEFVTLMEGLVLISNEFQNFAVQARFIESLAKPVCDQLKALEVHFGSPQAFSNFVGLDATKDCGEQRSEVAFCLNFLVALFRRTSVPTDLLKCRSSGFVDTSVGEVLAIKSPAADVGCHILPTVLKLTNIFIKMFATAGSYGKVFDMLDIEKNIVQGQSNQDDNNSESGQTNNTQNQHNIEDATLRKLQMFVYEQFEHLFQILAQFCNSLSHQFYKQPGLSNALVTSIFQNVEAVPDYRLRPIVKIFLKSLINKCPKACFGSVLAPVLTQFCPYMLNRLTDKWEKLKLARESPTFDENNTDSQEVIDDVLGRQITREYLDVIKAILTSGGGSDLSQTSVSSSASLTASSESLNKATNGGPPSHHLVLSELGTLVMRDEALGQCLTLTLLRALNWPDSQGSARASGLLEIIMPILSSSDKMSGADAAQVMINILQALHTMGQYEMNSIALNQLSIQAYEQLRPKHPVVLEVLGQVPGISVEDLKRFDARVMQLAAESSNNGTNKAGDRVLKTMFKKLTGNFVGKDVAQRFRKEVMIKNLPTLQLLKTRHKTPSLDDTESNDIGITTLFSNGTSPAKNTFML